MFDIEYVQLNFLIELSEYTILPMYKESAIRGGIGSVLMEEYCSVQMDCDSCFERKTCVYSNTMYSNYRIKPPFVTKGESMGFVLDCGNRQENFKAQEQFCFSMTLFGETITYFKEIVLAVIKLGETGIGKYNSKFRVIKITGLDDQTIFYRQKFTLEAINKNTLANYICSRKEENKQFKILCFKTPCTIKHEGRYLQKFHMQAIVNNLYRRVYMLNCFVGNESSLQYPSEHELPVIIKQIINEKEVRRYSNHQKSAMILKGIEGFALIYNLQESVLNYILAGEVIHIGKNTRFGFGSISLEE